MQLSDNTVHYGYQYSQDDPKVVTRQGTMRSHFEDPGDTNWTDRNEYTDHNQCLCDVDTIAVHKLRADPNRMKKSTFASGTHVYESPK
jgi:hypothetical protein